MNLYLTKIHELILSTDIETNFINALKHSLKCTHLNNNYEKVINLNSLKDTNNNVDNMDILLNTCNTLKQIGMIISKTEILSSFFPCIETLVTKNESYELLLKNIPLVILFDDNKYYYVDYTPMIINLSSLYNLNNNVKKTNYDYTNNEYVINNNIHLNRLVGYKRKYNQKELYLCKYAIRDYVESNINNSNEYKFKPIKSRYKVCAFC